MFIFISAYGLAYQYMHRKDESKLQFIVKRWISLMRTYWFVYVAVFVMCWLASKSPFEIYNNSAFNWLLDFMGWADFFGTPMLIGVWWYMCFAQMLILVIPLVNCMCKHLGWSSYFLTFLIMQYLPNGIKSPYGGRYSNYFLVVFLAVLCARNQIFDRILKQQRSKRKELLGFVVSSIMVILLLGAKFRFTDIDQWQFNSLLSSIVAFLICYITGKYCNNKYLVHMLLFLGKHSGNIFMIHAAFYTYYPKCVYWSGNAVISYCSLLILSLVFSVLFEFVKKHIHYNEVFQKGTNVLVKKINFEEDGN